MADKQPVRKVSDIQKEAEAIQCPVEKSLYLMREFLAGPMCGRCFPCAMGSYEAKVRIQMIMEGKGVEKDLAVLRMISEEMLIGSLCKKGKDVAVYMIELLENGSYQKHIEGICPDKTCKELIQYQIINEKCTMCGICTDVCKYHAIHGEKKQPFKSGYQPFEIRQKKCVKCDDCLKACPEDAIVIIDAKVRETVEV